MDPSATPSTFGDFPVVVFADYICPWSYASIDIVDRLEAEYGLVALWRPHLLHPEIPPAGVPYPDPSRLPATIAWFEETAPEAAARMKFPDRVRHSFRAFQATAYAVDMGRGNEFRRAVFDALWTAGADIGEVAILCELGEGVGLDRAGVLTALRDEQYFGRTVQAVQQAIRLEITATPTLILGTVRVNGWHYYEVLQGIVERQGCNALAAG